MTGRLIAIVGASGVGKDSVMAALVAADPRLTLARRVITRAPDSGGEDFTATDPASFATMAASGAFALHWRAHGLLYGIPAHINETLDAGHDVLVNLSRDVLPQAQAAFDCLVIHLTADRAVLAQRLAQRGRETADDIAARLSRADAALPQGLRAITIDNSGALDTTVQRILTLLYPRKA
jgi:ribose 1,5-bisphosphokinase